MGKSPRPKAVIPEDCENTSVHGQLYHGSYLGGLGDFAELKLPAGGSYRWTEDDEIPPSVFLTSNYDVAALYAGRDYNNPHGAVFLVDVQMDDVADCRDIKPHRKVAGKLIDAEYEGKDGAIVASTIMAAKYDSPEYLVFNPDETTKIVGINRNTHKKSEFVPQTPSQKRTKKPSAPRGMKGAPKLPGKKRK